ncbi:MAG: hypothetical protein WA733_02830 [Methylocystis sp.]
MKRSLQVLLLLMSSLISGTIALAEDTRLLGQWVSNQTVQGFQVQSFLQLSPNWQCVYEDHQNGQLIGSIQGSYRFATSLCNVDGPRIECSGQSEMGTPRKIGFTITSVGPSSLNATNDACQPLTFQRGTPAALSKDNEGSRDSGPGAPATCALACAGDAFCAAILARMDDLKACATDPRGVVLFGRARDIRGAYCDLGRRDSPNASATLQRFEQIRPPQNGIEQQIDAFAAQIAPQYCRR